jgi:hypothetical protein
VQRRAHALTHRGILRHGGAQVTRSIGDVPLLVAGDAAVAVDEAREQVVFVQVLGDEVEGGDAERALDHLVVEGDEFDLGAAVARIVDEALVGLDERLVEDAPEGVAQVLSRPRHMGGDPGGIRDDLVLEAGVELEVAGLVDLLAGQVGRLLLIVGGHHEAGELGRDPLLGDDQRRERPQHGVALGRLHRLP